MNINLGSILKWFRKKSSTSEKEEEKEEESEEQEEEPYEEPWVYEPPTRNYKKKVIKNLNDPIKGILMEQNTVLVEYILGRNDKLPGEIIKLITAYLTLLWDSARVIGYANPDFANQNPKPEVDKFGISKRPPTPKDWRGNFNGHALPRYSPFLYGGHMTLEKDTLSTYLAQNEDKVTAKMLFGRLEFGLSRQLGVGTTAVYDITPEEFKFLHSKVKRDPNVEVYRFCINYRVRVLYGSEQLGVILFSFKFIPYDIGSEPGVPDYRVELCYHGFTQKHQIFNEGRIYPKLPEDLEFEHYGHDSIINAFKNTAFVEVDRPTFGVVRAFIRSTGDEERPICQMLNFTQYIKNSNMNKNDIKVQFEMGFSGLYEHVASGFSLGKQLQITKRIIQKS